MTAARLAGKRFRHPVTVITSSTIEEVRPGAVTLVDEDVRRTVIPCGNPATCRTWPNTALPAEMQAAGLPVPDLRLVVLSLSP